MMLSAALAIVLSQQAVETAHQPLPVVKLESRRAGFGVADQVDISFYLRADDQGDAAWRVHLRRDYQGPPGQSEQLDRWIEGKDCSSVALAAGRLREFRPPEAYGPDEPGRAASMAPHGMRYVLTTVGAANGGESTTVTTDLTGLILGEAAASALGELRACLPET